MHESHPHYLLHHGPPPPQWSGEWGYPHAWEYPYAECGYPYAEEGYPYVDPYVGFDVSSIPSVATKWGHEIGEQIGHFGSAAGEALRNVAKGVGGGIGGGTTSWSPLGPVSDAAQKAGTAADSTTLAAEE